MERRCLQGIAFFTLVSATTEFIDEFPISESCHFSFIFRNKFCLEQNRDLITIPADNFVKIQSA